MFKNNCYIFVRNHVIIFGSLQGDLLIECAIIECTFLLNEFLN